MTNQAPTDIHVATFGILGFVSALVASQTNQSVDDVADIYAALIVRSLRIAAETSGRASLAVNARHP